MRECWRLLKENDLADGLGPRIAFVDNKFISQGQVKAAFHTLKDYQAQVKADIEDASAARKEGGCVQTPFSSCCRSKCRG